MNQDNNFVFLEIDLCDSNDQILLEGIFRDSGISYIFHFAAYAAEGLSPFIRQYNYNSNVIPTVFLINMGIKYSIKRFVFTSSMATYGRNKTPFTEDMTPHAPFDLRLLHHLPLGISRPGYPGCEF